MVMGVNSANASGIGSVLFAGLLIAGATVIGRRRQRI